jgi:plastocyanin
VLTIYRQLILFGLSCLLVSANIFAADFSGRVQITEKGKTAKTDEYADVVVYFIPDTRPDSRKDNPAEVKADEPEADLSESKQMAMKKKGFLPRVLSIQAGTTVNFPNFDPILHNAFSTSAKNKFDLGLYGGGEEKSYTFDKPGLVRVYCNVHHNMVAYILVFDSPYFTSIDSNGEFSLNDLPEASGQLVLWHPRAKVVKQKLDLASSAESQEFELKLTKRRIPKHKNKLGKSYRKKKERVY